MTASSASNVAREAPSPASYAVANCSMMARSAWEFGAGGESPGREACCAGSHEHVRARCSPTPRWCRASEGGGDGDELVEARRVDDRGNHLGPCSGRSGGSCDASSAAPMYLANRCGAMLLPHTGAAMRAPSRRCRTRCHATCTARATPIQCSFAVLRRTLGSLAGPRSCRCYLRRSSTAAVRCSTCSRVASSASGCVPVS